MIASEISGKTYLLKEFGQHNTLVPYGSAQVISVGVLQQMQSDPAAIGQVKTTDTGVQHSL